MKIIDTLQRSTPWTALSAALGKRWAINSVEEKLRWENILVKTDYGYEKEVQLCTLSYIDALSIGDSGKLVDCVSTWLKPVKIDGCQKFEEIWLRGLKHLASRKLISKDEADIPYLSNEIAVLWLPHVAQRMSWHEALEYVRSNELSSYDASRRLDNVNIDVTSVSIAELVRNNPAMLRLLRGRIKDLDKDELETLRKVTNNAVEDNKWWSILGCELLTEIDDLLLNDLETVVASRIAGKDNPISDTFAELCMVLGARTNVLP